MTDLEISEDNSDDKTKNRMRTETVSPCADPSAEWTVSTEELTIQYRLTRHTWRRIRFEVRADDAGWWRFEDEWTGCTWRPIGREVVNDLAVHRPNSSTEDDDDLA